MSTYRFIDALFPDGQALYYEGTFKGKTFAKHWAVLGRDDDGGLELDFYLELDPKPLGQGGPILKERCRLVLDRDLRPLGYGSEAAGARVSLKIDGDKIKVSLPDTTSRGFSWPALRARFSSAGTRGAGPPPP